MTDEGLPRVLEHRPIAAVYGFAREWIARFLAIQGIDRAMAVGAQAYTALFPLLIVYASVLPADRDFADTLVERFELTGASASTVERAFAPAGEVQSSVTALGVVLLLVSALSFTRGMQRMYEGAFGLPTLGMRNTKWGLLWLLVVTAVLGIRPSILGWLDGTPETVASIVLSGIVWLVTPYLLLGRRLRPAKLAPVAVLTTIGMTGVGIWSAIWMPHTLAASSRQFGIIGVGFALLTWLVAIGCVLVATAAGGAVLAERFERRHPPS